jgi:hypothetical protein
MHSMKMNYWTKNQSIILTLFARDESVAKRLARRAKDLKLNYAKNTKRMLIISIPCVVLRLR